jgi:hypothetical protein
MPQREHTRESLIAAAAEFARATECVITFESFARKHEVPSSQVYRHFDSFAELLEAAGAGNRVSRIRRVSRMALLREFHRVAELVGREPTRKDIEKHARVGSKTFNTHIGSWPVIRLAYARWKAGGCPEREEPAADLPPVAPRLSDLPAEAPEREPRDKPGVKATGPLMGEPLGFRGLMHAPVNEMGVIHLFGLLQQDLEIAVEHIGATFPDCRALKLERTHSMPRWRRIAVEFEYRSSNFRAHGHDPDKCDLIVCWEHDWAECPIEVLELRTVLGRLRAAA